MAYKALPPKDNLHQLFRYDPETGILYWRERHEDMFKDGAQPKSHNAAIWNAKNAGKPAGSKVAAGYIDVSVLSAGRLLAHRVIWKMMTGDEPNDIDHINGNRSDNRFANLRSVTHETNGRNLSRRVNNTSGAVGVSRHRRKWVARINPARKTIYLGIFDSFDDAVAARRAAEVKYGFHENHGQR